MADLSFFRRALVAACVILFVSPAAQAQVDFIAARDSLANPQGVAVGDFDEDGHMDVAMRSGSTVLLRLNDGLDRYRPGAVLPIGHPITLLHVADQNQDGHADLIVGAYDSSAPLDPVEVYRGYGDGTFASPVRLFVDLIPVSVDAVDVDADGDLDLVVAASDTVSVFRANGSGFLSRSVYPIWASLNQVEVADVTADGIGDVLVSSFYNFTYWTGNPDGTFDVIVSDQVPLESGTAVWHTAVEDIDFDGDDDLLHAMSLGWVGVQYNEGSGGFSEVFYTQGRIAEEAFVVARMDGDATYDVVGIANQSIQVWRGVDGSPGFLPIHTVLLTSAIDLALGDFDGDGDLDVVATQSGTPANRSVAVYLNDGSGVLSMSSRVVTDVRAEHVEVGDFDDDGNLDVVLEDDDGLKVLLGDGSGGLGAPTIIQLNASFEQMIVGDIVEDGHVDIAIVGGSASVDVYSGDGTGGFALVATIPAQSLEEFTDLVLEDIDLDGHLDIAYPDLANVRVAFGDGAGGFTEPVAHPLVAMSRTLASGDFDTDGFLDFAVGKIVHDAGHQLLFGDGLGGFGPGSGIEIWPDLGCLGFAYADFDSDGVGDVLLNGEGARLLRGRAAGGFDPPVSLPIASVPSAPVAADMNDDGELDVVFYGRPDQFEPSSVVVALGDGAAGFPSVSTVQLDAEPAGRAAIADVTNDGKLDVVMSGRAESIVLLAGSGDGNLRTGTAIPDAGGAVTDFASGDFDADGRIDIAYVAGFPPRVGVAFGDGAGGFAAPVETTVPRVPVRIVACDLDGNALDDLVIVDSANLRAYTMNGGGVVTLSDVFPLGATPRDLVFADFDLDGKDDVAVSTGGAGSVELYYGVGNGEFVPGAPVTDVLDPYALVVGDFDSMDGTGRPDLCVIDPEAIAVSFLRNAGGRTFTKEASFLYTGGVRDALIAEDFDDDGSLDLGYATGSVVVRRFGSGFGTFPTLQNTSIGRSLRGLGVGEFDRDGELDLVAICEESRFSVLLGESASPHFSAPFWFAGEARQHSGDGLFTDLNGDGYDDIVLASDAGITVHLNRTDRAIRCRAGAVDTAGHGSPVDVLRVNDSTGTTTTRDLAVDSLDPLLVELDRAPTPAVNNRYYAAVWEGRPVQPMVALLPKSIGFACFSPLRNDPRYVTPLEVANTLRPTDPRLDPPSATATGDPLPAVVVSVPGGTFPVGTTLTVQGLLGDGKSPSPKRVSLTNAVVVAIE